MTETELYTAKTYAKHALAEALSTYLKTSAAMDDTNDDIKTDIDEIFADNGLAFELVEI